MTLGTTLSFTDTVATVLALTKSNVPSAAVQRTPVNNAVANPIYSIYRFSYPYA